MKAIEKRLRSLEGQRQRANYDHLSDGELQARACDVLEGLAAMGVPLAATWRDDFAADPAGFLQEQTGQWRCLQ